MEYYDMLNNAALKERVDFNEDKYNKFILYKDMIKEWNKKINLTAITEDEEIVKKHFIDSFKIFKFEKLKECKKIIDIGTGAGFPGIPMKIVKENLEITLLDSLKKRITFLDEVINNLKLENVETIHGRAEDFAKDKKYREQYDAVVSRAVANMTVLSEFCIPFVKKGGYFVALKGPAITEELEEAQKAIKILGGKIQQIIEVDIDGSDLRHNLVVVKKIKETPKAYPRKAGVVSKKPLK
ncbi:16S rRNA (guanine(527)-N(7))-methyltransferase RsmG [Haloimpatiens lingqiaonensis]|uniref:16S rRNA (guanine(527)-N(7))-methyltransferase RsmG n=1 Tax=Haloimpatiens lingqiaonensis TaxID=1380675 RepID=UPI0010FE0823|nr:16S rRNA (guanine(527)-N(7))-methyltransferase RsmG [Haloimpatiens lingqiaonensis]